MLEMLNCFIISPVIFGLSVEFALKHSLIAFVLMLAISAVVLIKEDKEAKRKRGKKMNKNECTYLNNLTESIMQANPDGIIDGEDRLLLDEASERLHAFAERLHEFAKCNI
jgi:hypothetical protein